MRLINTTGFVECHKEKIKENLNAEDAKRKKRKAGKQAGRRAATESAIVSKKSKSFR